MSNALQQFRRAALSVVILAAAFAAACADDHPSAPTGPRTGSGSHANGDATAMMQGAAVSNAKPVDQVGFTKVNYVESEWVVVAAGGSNSGSVTCPTGSVPTGGGYHLQTVSGLAQPTVVYSGPIGLPTSPTGWELALYNTAAGSGIASFQVFVMCAS